MSSTRSFYLPDDVLDAIAAAGGGSAYISVLVRRDAQRRRSLAPQADAGPSDGDRESARHWAREQLASMKRQPADYADVREALGIPKAASDLLHPRHNIRPPAGMRGEDR